MLACDHSLSMELAENSVDAAPARVIGRPFQPGQSGNLGGRPKGLARYVRELVGDDGRRIAEFMLGVLEDESERTETRMEAARWLADRGFGRATQPLRAEHEREEVIYESTVLDILSAGEKQRAQLIAGEA